MASFEELPEEQKLNLARAAHKLYSNPETSKKAKRLLMEADKSVRFPELEVEDQVNAQTEEQKKRIAELEAKMIQQSAEDNRAKKHQQARDAGLDPADVEKAIIDRGIGNWETAMEFVRLTQQAAAATPEATAGGHFELPDGKNDWWKDPTKAARKAAHEAIDELRGRRRA
jgi:hypothetical protein